MLLTAVPQELTVCIGH